MPTYTPEELRQRAKEKAMVDSPMGAERAVVDAKAEQYYQEWAKGTADATGKPLAESGVTADGRAVAPEELKAAQYKDLLKGSEPDWSKWNVQQGWSGPYTDKVNQAGQLGQEATGVSDRYAQNQRYNADTARQGQQSTIDMLNRYATGQDSVVAAQTKLQQEQARKAMASQLASSSRGGFNPAAVRGAQNALGNTQAQLGAAGAIGQMQERQAATNALLAGQTGLRQQDLGALGAELGNDQALRNLLLQRSLGQDASAQAWAKSGLMDKYATATSAQQAEMARRANDVSLLNMGQRQVLGSQYQPTGTDWGSVIGGIGMGIGGLAAMFSDEQLKEKISSADDDLDKMMSDLIGKAAGQATATAAGGPIAAPMTIAAQAAPKAATLAEKPTSNGHRYLAASQGFGAGLGKVIQGFDGVDKLRQVGVPESDQENWLAGNLLPGRQPGLVSYQDLYSDERCKEGIVGNPGEVDKFVENLHPYEYEYKAPLKESLPGRRIGVMAQDVERSGIGRMLVSEGPGGAKMISLDPKETTPVILASLGRLSDRLSKLEKGKK
jgi:hypothetical protein